MDEKLIYTNRRGILLHVISIGSMAISIYLLYLLFGNIHDLVSELPSKNFGYFIVVLLTLLVFVIPVFIIWLHGRYVLKIIKTVYPNEIAVTTWSFFGNYRTKKYPEDIFSQAKYKKGKYLNPDGVSVDAPWLKITTPDNKILIIDLQGDIMDDKILKY
ncbi:MAG: hypothetical protein M9887_04360 [Chitinophagales bacterium]|nr:hypothetical protein [Chitinophagales bacterium]